MSVPFIPNSPTSRAAAEAVEPKVGTQKATVLAAIRDSGERGLTDAEALSLTYAQGVGHNSIRARRGALAMAGLIVRNGERTNPITNKSADVWVAVEFARVAS